MPPVSVREHIQTLWATLSGHLPTVAAAFSITWSIIRIIETRTVSRLLKRWRKPDAPTRPED